MKASWLHQLRLIGVFILICSFSAKSQPWSFDFGTNTGIHNSGASTTFLPAPPFGNTRVRIGSQSGSVELRNPGDARIGSATEAVLVAPTGSSLNKMQWYDFNGSRLFTLQTTISIGGGEGDVYFFCGNGSCFSDNVGFSSSQVFAALRWLQDSSGLALAARNPGGWTPIQSSPMQTDSVHLLEVYANNSNNSNSYVHGSSYTVAPFTYDVWIDDSLLIDDEAGAGLGDSLDIDSFMFYAAGSPANDCTLTIDDITYTNTLAGQPLPVELSVFELREYNGELKLRWETITEIQNFGFEIQRSRADGEWEVAGFVAGDGDRQTPRWYEWTDTLRSPAGELRYRLRQIDRDGSFTFSPVRSIRLSTETEGFILGTPWPNPARDFIVIPLSTFRECTVELQLLTLAGTQVAVLSRTRLLPAAGQNLRLPCGQLPRGLHLLTIRSETQVRSCLVLLI